MEEGKVVEVRPIMRLLKLLRQEITSKGVEQSDWLLYTFWR
jgi:hypothetical protein